MTEQTKVTTLEQVVIRFSGDSGDGEMRFAAGILYALTDTELGKDKQTVIDFATAASCLCHSIMQDVNYVSRADVIALMHSGGHGTVSR